MSEQLKETLLVDKYGDDAAVSVNLNDLLAFINSNFPDLIASVHHDDHEHYIEIKGACACIYLKKNFGGMYCPDNYLDCEVIASVYRNKDTSTSHKFLFKNENPNEISIRKNYAESIIDYLKNNLCYLQADNSIFKRIDFRWYDDLSGANRMQTASYDTIHVSDDDFYIESDLKQTYLNSTIEIPVSREKQIIATEYGDIIVEKLTPDEIANQNNVLMFVASLDDDDQYSYARGATVQEAVDRYIEIFMSDGNTPN